MPQQVEFAHPPHELPIRRRAVAADQGFIEVARVADELHHLARRAAKPAGKEFRIRHARRVGDADEPVVAGESCRAPPPRLSSPEGREQQPLPARPRHLEQQPPRLAHPAQVRQRPRLVEHAGEHVSDRREHLHVMMGIDRGGRADDEFAEAVVLRLQFRFDLGGHDPAQRQPAQEAAQHPEAAVWADQ